MAAKIGLAVEMGSTCEVLPFQTQDKGAVLEKGLLNGREAASPMVSFEEHIDSHVGFKQESLAAIHAALGLNGHDAFMLY